MTTDTDGLLADVPSAVPDASTPAGRIGLRRDVDPTLAADLVKLHDDIEAKRDVRPGDLQVAGAWFVDMRAAARLALRHAVEQASNNAAAMRRVAELNDQLRAYAATADATDRQTGELVRQRDDARRDTQRAERAAEARAADLRSALATVDQLRAEAAAQQRQLLALLRRYLELGEECDVLRGAAADAATSFGTACGPHCTSTTDDCPHPF